MRAWGIVAIVLGLWFVTGCITAVLLGRMIELGEDE